MLAITGLQCEWPLANWGMLMATHFNPTRIGCEACQPHSRSMKTLRTTSLVSHRMATRPCLVPVQASLVTGPATPLFSGCWPLWTCLAVCAAASHVIERRTPFGAVLSSPLGSMLLGLLATASGMIPAAGVEYDSIWVYFMPLAAALYLLEADLGRWGWTLCLCVSAPSISSHPVP